MVDVASTFQARSNGHAHGDGARAPARALTATIATGDMLDVRRFDVTDRMSALFEVHLVAVSDNPDIDFEAAIGMPMRFDMQARGARTWTGVCSHLRQIAVEERNLSTYELTLVPTLWLLTQRRNHRMFQQMSEVDIVLQILGEWGIAPTLKLGGAYKKRKYRVQYGESDYAFVSRMLEDAGVSFYFDGGGDLVLDDGPHENGARAPLAFRDNPTETDQEHATHVRVGRRLRPGKYTVRDHDHRRPPTYKLMASAEVGGVEGRLERFHYTPGAFLFESDRGETNPAADDKGKYRTDEAEGKQIAERRLSAKRASAREVSFLTNVIDPAPGTVLSFLDHPKSELGPGKQLLVVESKLSGEVPGVWTHACSAVSADAPYRPALRTRKPRAQGVESATVVGPPGEEIHVDEHGRVRVHFHWDRESRMNDASSCWIHVSQPWGGAAYGGSNLPRVGQEVIVDFLGGDPDRPVIVGRVYTGLQKTPYKLPENKTQSGWKSNSTRGTGGYNEIMFEDAAGRELVRMQAEKDLHKLVKNDETVSIGNDRSKEVGRDDRHEVGRDRHHSVGRDELSKIAQDRTGKIGRDESHTVGQDQSVTIGKDQSITVGNDLTVRVGQNEDVTVGQDLTKNVGNNERETTGQNRTISVGQNRTSDVGLTDSTSVGEKFYVEVKPPDDASDDDGDDDGASADGADGGDDAGEDGDGAGSTPTSATMTDKKIVFTTGAGATITMEGAEVRIEADVIRFIAKKNIAADAQSEDVVIHARKDISLKSDRTLHATTAAGVLAVHAKGGDVKIDSDHSVVVKASSEVSTSSASARIRATQTATVSGKDRAELSSEGTASVEGHVEADLKAPHVHVEGGQTTQVKTADGPMLIKARTVDINP